MKAVWSGSDATELQFSLKLVGFWSSLIFLKKCFAPCGLFVGTVFWEGLYRPLGFPVAS